MKKAVLGYLVVAVAGLAAAFVPISVHAAAGDLYASEFNTNTVLKFTPAGTKTPFVTGLNGPRGLAFDGSGNLFEGEFSGTIFKIAPDGTKTTFATGVGNVFGLAFDAFGNLFAADLNSGTIFKFAPDGTKTTFAAGLTAPRPLAFDLAGNLFVGEGTMISKFTPDGMKTTFASGLNNPGGLAFDTTGNLFEADLSSGNIFKFAPDGTKTTFASGLNSPFGLAFDSSGNLFEVDNGSGTIFIFTPSGTKSTFATGLSSPTYLAFAIVPHALFNISTRGFVGTGDAVLIGGFIVTGNGMVNSKVLIRAAGPSLTSQGVAGALQDPVLRIFNSSGAVILSNDNWKETQQAAIQATGLAPTDDRESAILASLPSGAFTAIITGAGNSTGIARVDIFNVQ
jgi:Gluconolactonase